MERRDVERLMDAYLDGELSVEQGRAIEAALASDAELQRVYGPMLRLLRSPAPVEMPAGLRARVLAAVEATEPCSAPVVVEPPVSRWERAFLRSWKWIGAAAACVAFFAMGWLASYEWRPAPVAQQPVGSNGGGGKADTDPVVVSPWMLASLAQAATLPGPSIPAVVLVQGAATELMLTPRGDELDFEVQRRRDWHEDDLFPSVPPEAEIGNLMLLNPAMGA